MAVTPSKNRSNLSKGLTEAEIPLPWAGRMVLVAVLLLVLLPHLVRLPLAMTAFALAVVGWRLLKEWRGWPLPPTSIRIGLMVVAILLVVQQFHSVVGRLPGAALLIAMLTLKLLELRSLRDALVLIFISYFLVTVNFLFDQSLLVGAYLLVVVLMLTFALLLLNHPNADLRQSLPHLKWAARLLIQALPVMVLLFLLFPRLNTPLWSLPSERGVAKTGLSETMSFGAITELVDSYEVAFRVDFSAAPPAAQQLYWRVMVLWNSDGWRWEPLNRAQQQQAAGAVVQLEAKSSPYPYTLTLEPHQQQWLPLLDRAVQLPQGAGQPLTLLPDMQIRLTQNLTKTVRLEALSVSDYRDGQLDGWAWEAALELPEGLHPQARALAATWQREGLTDEQRVARALDYFRQQPFYYTRRPPPMERDPVDQFLFEARRGFCEHYAAAFVVLMRAAGVPARVVTGYQGGEINPLGHYLMVRQSDAHAWSEIWLESRGWVRFDPTAVIPLDRIENRGDTMRFESLDPKPLPLWGGVWLAEGWRLLQNSFDTINHQWNRWVVGFNPERQRQILQALGLQSWSMTEMLLLVVGLVALLVVMMAVVLLLRRRSIDPVVRIWQRLTEIGAIGGVALAAGETARHYVTRLNTAYPTAAPLLALWLERYEQLRYDPQQSVTPERLAQLKQQLKLWHQAMKKPLRTG